MARLHQVFLVNILGRLEYEIYQNPPPHAPSAYMTDIDQPAMVRRRVDSPLVVERTQYGRPVVWRLTKRSVPGTDPPVYEILFDKVCYVDATFPSTKRKKKEDDEDDDDSPPPKRANQGNKSSSWAPKMQLLSFCGFFYNVFCIHHLINTTAVSDGKRKGTSAGFWQNMEVDCENQTPSSPTEVEQSAEPVSAENSPCRQNDQADQAVDVSPSEDKDDKVEEVKSIHNMDEGQISDDGDAKESLKKPRGTDPEPIRSSPSSSDDEEQKKQAKTRLERLKNMRFAGHAHKKFSPGTPQRRTVRSFLDEKLASDEPEATHRPRKRSPSPEEERERERERHPRRKRRHDDEERDRDRRKERPERVHLPNNNPQTITQKVQTILARCDGPCDIPEDDLRTIVLETVMLEKELQAMYEKRKNLEKEMEEMAATERDTIKKVHSSLPAHMQTVIKFEGDNIGINDAPILNPAMPPMPPFPPGVFPPIPSMLQSGMPPFPPGFPPIGPNGMPMFPFPGMMPPENRPNSPGAEVPEMKNGTHTPPEQVQWSSGVPKMDAKPESPFEQVAWTSSSGNFSNAYHEVPPGSRADPGRQIDFSKPPPLTNSNNGSSSNLPDLAMPPPGAFNMPPPSFLFEKDGDGASAPYQSNSSGRPPNQFSGPMQPNDLCKTLTSMITNAIKAPPTSFSSPPPGMMGSSLLGPPPGRSSSPMMAPRPNPPSLMSIPTKDPYNLGTMRIGPPGGGGGSGGNYGKGGHRKKGFGRAGRELREHTSSPRGNI